MTMKKTRVLIVDDEVGVLRYVSGLLRKEGYETINVANGEAGLSVAETENPSLVILDIIMPGMNGFDVCCRLREWSSVPIIMLSARDREGDKVKCLDSGADDYITKPFGGGELLARVRAVLRRAGAGASLPSRASFTSAGLEVNFAQRKLTLGGREVKLTPTEFSLLQELTLNAGKVLTHTQLLQKVWGAEYQEEKEYVHEFISRLRNKIERDKENPAFIISIPGVGYKFREEESVGAGAV